MNEIYPMWVAAHGIMIVTPVNWYQVSSPLKLMMDRLVCAAGGNPDPTRTHGKDAKRAKAIELAGWDYPRHLAGRVFSVVVHGDVEGAENVRRSISDWLCFMRLTPAGHGAELDRYIGYWKPYAASHDALDGDTAIQAEVRNAAKILLAQVTAARLDECACLVARHRLQTASEYELLSGECFVRRGRSAAREFGANARSAETLAQIKVALVVEPVAHRLGHGQADLVYVVNLFDGCRC